MENNKGKTLIFTHYDRLKDLEVIEEEEFIAIVNDVCALNFHDLTSDLKVLEELLICLSKLIGPDKDASMQKFCTFIYFLFHRKKISLTPTFIQYMVEFLLSSISSGANSLSDILLTLSSLLQENADKIDSLNEDILAKSCVLMDIIPVQQDQSIEYNAFLCFYNILIKYQAQLHLNEKLLGKCCEKCIFIMKERVERILDVISLKILICSLKCLQLIFLCKNVPVKSLGELLGSLKRILFLGLPGHSILSDAYLYPTLSFPPVPQASNDSQSESDASYQPKFRKQKKNRRNRVKKKAQNKGLDVSELTEGEDEAEYIVNTLANGISNLPFLSFHPKRLSRTSWTQSSSSDSEFSDVEFQAFKVKSLQSSVRQAAYQALHAIVKTTSKKLIFGYWSSFIPDYPSMPGSASGQNIFTTILKDPAPHVRLSALALLAEMLRGSKQFLAFADGCTTCHTSFTPLSVVLASIINELHRCLLLILKSENAPAHITQILKCYAILIENVPYKKLNKVLLYKLLNNIKGFLLHKDTQVQVACLTVFGSLVNSDEVPDDIGELLMSPNFETVIVSLQDSSSSLHNDIKSLIPQMPWIFNLCRRYIFNDDPLPVRLEALQLLCSIVGKYFHKMYCLISIIEDIVLYCLNEPDTSLQLHGAKLLEVFGRCLSTSSKLENKDLLDTTISRMWENILLGPFIPCLTNNSQKSLQSVCCDCLSTVPCKIFQELPEKQQVLYITMLLGLASDDNPNIRGAAIRTLGVYSLFPCLIQDFHFLSHIAEILIDAALDSNINVRFKASWAIGNLSDALLSNRDEMQDDKEIPVKLFFSIGMTCVHFSKDVDRVKANAVRALGNFLHCIPDGFLDIPIIHNFIREASLALKIAVSANVMKTCWNACYALGNMFKNVDLVESELFDMDELLQCLLKALKSPNFKVRISAAQALTTLSYRGYYGELFSEIWLALVASLYSAATDVNFKEIKHQENLCDQICYSLCQLSVLLSLDDIDDISSETFDASEILLTSMWKFGQRMSLEKMNFVSSACEHLSNLMKNLDNQDIVHFISIMYDVLTQAITSFHGSDVVS